MNERQREEFAQGARMQFRTQVPDVARFGSMSSCSSSIPAWSSGQFRRRSRALPSWRCRRSLKDIVMTKRGLVLVVGATGSGKSTSLAAMIDHRNRYSSGHIITVEDPVEFVHQSQISLVTHRDVGVDTHSWHRALKNTLRQAPDVILIGEIRDAETMEHAITFAETGHLCLSTLHANSANQTIDRIVNFFPDERRAQLLMDLSSNLQRHHFAAPDPHRRRKAARAAMEILSIRRSSPRQTSEGRIPRDRRSSWASRGSSACAPSTGRCSSCIQ